MFLDPDELKQRTNRERSGAQRKALDFMGMPYKVRADGSIVVLRSAIEEVMGARNDSHFKKSSKPNWDALNATCKKSGERRAA